MKWFKFYGQDFLTDSKLSGLNPYQRLMWVVLLCMASQDDKKSGILPFFSEARLVALSGLNYDDMESMYGMKQDVTIETFCNMGIVKWLNKNTLLVTNYHQKQTQQSTSTERVADYRLRIKAKKQDRPNVTNETNVTLQSNNRVEESRVDKIRIDNKDMSAHADDPFSKFWNLYPKKELKKKSKEIWERKKLDSSLKEISEFIELAKGTDRWQKGFIKQPPVFLSGECWNDDLMAYNDTQSAGFTKIS